MAKTKLKTFKSESATTEVRAGGNLIKIREERGILQRFIVISRSRSDLDLKECIGILHHIEKCQIAKAGAIEEPENNLSDYVQVQAAGDRVLIIDGMAVVNSVAKTDRMKTCADFANSFLSTVCNLAQDFDEVRLVFDRYTCTSIKAHMRIKKTQGKQLTTM